jgi:hypothetical protein
MGRAFHPIEARRFSPQVEDGVREIQQIMSISPWRDQQKAISEFRKNKLEEGKFSIPEQNYLLTELGNAVRNER